MNQGVIYYNKGTKCIQRMMVSLSTLRHHYTGPVSILIEKDNESGWFPDEFMPIVRKFNANIVNIPEDQCVGYPLVQKTRLWRWTPYDMSLFMDTDTIVCDSIDHLFDDIPSHTFCVTRFCDWRSDGNRIGGRIKQWKPLIGKQEVKNALEFGPALNTGVFGFRKDCEFVRAWEKLCVSGYEFRESGKGEILNRTFDESACQVLAHQFPEIKIWDARYNESVQYGTSEKPCIIHFHGGKHLLTSLEKNNPDIIGRCNQWRDAYWNLRNSLTAPEYGVMGDWYGDKNLRHELTEVQKKNVTICTAADKGYADRLYRNMSEWMLAPGLREQQFIVFCLNIAADDPTFDRFREWGNVKLVEWWYASNNRREAAFSAFIFGTLQHVKTQYWMKLDGDTQLLLGRFEWPTINHESVIATKWHYTKVKGDDDAEEHWLNTLDRNWREQFGDDAIFPYINLEETKRHSHRRLRSFCWIEDIDHTKRVAGFCTSVMKEEKMIIPSHDTTSWYVGHRLYEDRMREHSEFNKFVRA